MAGGKIFEASGPNYPPTPPPLCGCAFFRICNEHFSAYRGALVGKVQDLCIAKARCAVNLPYLPHNTARRHWTVYSDALFSPAIL